MNTPIDRARKYAQKIDPAVSGSDGRTQTFKSATALVPKFGTVLDEDSESWLTMDTPTEFDGTALVAALLTELQIPSFTCSNCGFVLPSGGEGGRGGKHEWFCLRCTERFELQRWEEAK